MVANSPEQTHVLHNIKTSKRYWYLWLIGIFAILGMGGMAIWFAMDFSATLNPQQKLQEAQQQWESADINAYRAHVVVNIPLRVDNLYRVEVQDGMMITTATINPKTFRYDPNPPTFELSPAQGEPYTIASLFWQAERLVSTFDKMHLYTPITSNVVYNAEYGYVEKYTHNRCGIFLTFVPECITTYEVVRFEVLNNIDPLTQPED